MLDTQKVSLWTGHQTVSLTDTYFNQEILLIIYKCVCVCVCDTSAVGNRGTANCSRPWIWICMVVRDLWKMVRGCKQDIQSVNKAEIVK